MCRHRDGEANEKPHGPVLFWLEPSWKLVIIFSINTAKFHLNRVPKSVYVAVFRRHFSAAFMSFLSTWTTVQAQKASPPHLWSFFSLLRNAHASISISPVVCPNSECVDMNLPKATKILPGKGSSRLFQLFRPIMTFTRATCKQQSTSAHFQRLPSKENTRNKHQMQELERGCREKPNMASQELALMSHVWTGELSAFEGRQQLTQAATNSQVPPWQGVSHPQNQVRSADSEKSCVCQSPLTWSLRGSCAEIKSWGYSESCWTQSNNIILLVKPKSLCL